MAIEAGAGTCFVQYDPEVNAATLRFSEAGRSGGPTGQILAGSSLLGTVRLTADRSFNYLELLGASRAIPQFVSGLTAPADGVRDFHRGEFIVPISVADDQSCVTVTFAETAESGADMEVVDVMSAGSTETLARVRLLSNGAVLDLTLLAVGPLIAKLIDQISSRE